MLASFSDSAVFLTRPSISLDGSPTLVRPPGQLFRGKKHQKSCPERTSNPLGLVTNWIGASANCRTLTSPGVPFPAARRCDKVGQLNFVKAGLSRRTGSARGVFVNSGSIATRARGLSKEPCPLIRLSPCKPALPEAAVAGSKCDRAWSGLSIMWRGLPLVCHCLAISVCRSC